MSTSEESGEATPKLALIVARARNGVIGREGGVPWRLKADLAFFKRATMGKPLLMGRKTWESLPGVLPGRPHLVLTSDPGYAPQGLKGAEVLYDFELMLMRARAIAEESGADEIMVIGGESLYRLALPTADRLYLTEVDAEVEGDTVFPHIDETAWVETSAERHAADADNDHPFTIRVLERAG